MIALVALAVLFPILISQTSTFFVNQDNVDQYYTWYQKLALGLKHGYIPIWNASVFSGQAFAGEIQPGMLSPVNIIWVWIFGHSGHISELSLNYLIAVHFIAAAFGCFLLLKELHISWRSSLLAGLVFAFSGPLVIRAVSQISIFYGLALMVYPLYFMVKHHNTHKKRWLIFSGVALAITLVAGHIQPTYHAALLVVFIELAYLWKRYGRLILKYKNIKKTIKNFIIIGVSFLVIALPQLWVSYNYLPDTYRIQASGYSGPGEKLSYGDFSKAFRIDIHEYANYIDPITYPIRDGNDLFVGLVPLVIVLLVLIYGREEFKKHKTWQQYGLFIKSLLIFSLLTVLGYATWFAVVLYKLPVVYQIRQLGRYAILLHLLLAIIFGVSLDVLAKIKLTNKQKRVIFAIGVFLFINGIYLYLLRNHIFSLHQALHEGLAGLTFIVISALTNKSGMQKATLSIAVVASLLITTIWYIPDLSKKSVLVGNYKLSDDIVQMLESTDGNYRIASDQDAIRSNSGNIYHFQMVGGYGATIYAPYYVIKHQIYTGNNDFILDLLGVKYLVNKTQSPTEAHRDDNTYVHERSSVLKKAFKTKVQNSTNRQDYTSIDITTLRYEDHHQSYEVYHDSESEVIFSEIYYPGWSATIDGKKTNITNYSIGEYPLLRQIRIPAGRHTVNFDFKPFGVF
jgi:hypothetical protein